METSEQACVGHGAPGTRGAGGGGALLCSRAYEGLVIIRKLPPVIGRATFTASLHQQLPLFLILNTQHIAPSNCPDPVPQPATDNHRP